MASTIEDDGAGHHGDLLGAYCGRDASVGDGLTDDAGPGTREEVTTAPDASIG